MGRGSGIATTARVDYVYQQTVENVRFDGAVTDEPKGFPNVKLQKIWFMNLADRES